MSIKTEDPLPHGRNEGGPALIELYRRMVLIREAEKNGLNYGFPYCHAGGIVDPDVKRANANACDGVTLTVTELVGWEHSMKNELIIATRTQQPHQPNRRAAERVIEMLDMLGLVEFQGRFFIPD